MLYEVPGKTTRRPRAAAAAAAASGIRQKVVVRGEWQRGEGAKAIAVDNNNIIYIE